MKSLIQQVEQQGFVKSYGCTLTTNGDRFVMYCDRNESRRHELAIASTHEARLLAHWQGFIENNKFFEECQTPEPSLFIIHIRERTAHKAASREIKASLEFATADKKQFTIRDLHIAMNTMAFASPEREIPQLYRAACGAVSKARTWAKVVEILNQCQAAMDAVIAHNLEVQKAAYEQKMGIK